MEDTIDIKKIYTQTIEANWLLEKNVTLDVLRLDVIDKIISGNKWFKLKYYLQDAFEKGVETIATFGGAYSNHIIAMAYACKLAGFKSVGIIRGERPKEFSHTLLMAQEFGMDIHFVSRTAYRNKEMIKADFSNVYWVNEGGYGIKGMVGAKEILLLTDKTKNYSHIICAVGTGTMMAGIIEASNEDQQVMGICVMKGNSEMLKNISGLTSKNTDKKYKIIQGYHFGGYAKHPPELINFMNITFKKYLLPTDIIYTSKTFYAIEKMILNNTFPSGSKILMIHSGGLQGNLSLPANSLCF